MMSSPHVRGRLALVFAVLLAGAARFAGQGPDAADKKDLQRYQRGVPFLRALTTRVDTPFTEEEQRQLQDLFLQLNQATIYWSQSGDSGSPVAAQARRDCADAVARLSLLFERSGRVERVWTKPDKLAESSIRRAWPSGSGMLALRVGRQDLPPDPVPLFLQAQANLSQRSEIRLDAGDAQTAFALVALDGAPTGAKQALLRFRSGRAELAQVHVGIETPPTGALHVTVVDESGKPTPAAAGVYGAGNELMVPDTALAFDRGGHYYNAGRARPNAQARYWPGSPQQRRVFFVDGAYSLRLPEGEYRVIAGKGAEYLPVSQTITVKAGAEATRRLELKRWVDMPAKGWYSGDGHVHYERLDPEANRRLLLWTRAEDVHVANVLRMGDAKQTYFEQYAFGAHGRLVDGAYALVPGQEDPRTNVMGHTLQLNLQKAFRAAERYYLYDLAWDETRRQGGLTGYAHFYRPAAQAYFVQRDMTLNVARGKIDFVELCEFGDLDAQAYYEFLNLGFPLTATAGSDVPWGNTIGTSRVYAYTGERFDADAWFAAVKAGRTFVTTGTMLELTVNGQLPGSVIEASRGDTLRIKASASHKPAPPGYLEVMSQGEVIRSAAGGGELEFTVPVTGSTWIAARSPGAHTTPVYVKVNGRRFWRLDQVEALIARRMDQLQQLDELPSKELSVSHVGNWDNPVAMKEGAAELRERVRAARKIYQDMLAEAKSEMAEAKR